jgi:hypothetical protein
LGSVATIVDTEIVLLELLSKANNGPIGPIAAACLDSIGLADTSASGRTEKKKILSLELTNSGVDHSLLIYIYTYNVARISFGSSEFRDQIGTLVIFRSLILYMHIEGLFVDGSETG